MATKAVSIDVTECREFFEQMGKASSEFRKEMETWLDAIGTNFLDTVQDEIIRLQVTDTRLLLTSFDKGATDNVWEKSDGGLTLEVGSVVDYASYVNDGHWTNPKGTDMRFVPGYWDGDHFIYMPGYKDENGHSSGMMLKQKWVEGSHYFDSALRIMDAMFPQFLENKMEQWLKKYF